MKNYWVKLTVKTIHLTRYVRFGGEDDEKKISIHDKLVHMDESKDEILSDM